MRDYNEFQTEERLHDHLARQADKPLHERYAAAAVSAVEDEARNQMIAEFGVRRENQYTKAEEERAEKQRAAAVRALEGGATKIERGESIMLAYSAYGGSLVGGTPHHVVVTQVLAGIPVEEQQKAFDEMMEAAEAFEARLQTAKSREEREGMIRAEAEKSGAGRLVFAPTEKPPVVVEQTVSLGGPDLKRLRDFLNGLPEEAFRDVPAPVPVAQFGPESFTAGGPGRPW